MHVKVMNYGLIMLRLVGSGRIIHSIFHPLENLSVELVFVDGRLHVRIVDPRIINCL